ncbi:MAG: MarC family protein [Acidobacteria bacterium]|nr:MarC family protein [Candidatus Sulfomarinibacter kjeldsenii]
MNPYVQAAVAVLAVVNPVVSGAILLKLVFGQPRNRQILAATRGVVTVLIILVAAAFVGQFILNVFGISMETFRIVGGVIVAYIGFQMLGGGGRDDDDQPDSDGDLSKLVMFAASPGTIATVVTLSAVHTPGGIPLTALVGIVVALAATWGVMVAMVLASSRIHAGKQHFATQFMGLILVAMGLQFALEGYKAFMAP